MKKWAVVFILFSSMSHAADYCVSWEEKGLNPNHHTVNAKCTNSKPILGFGVFPLARPDYMSATPNAFGAISLESAQQSITSQIAQSGFQPIAQIQDYTIYGLAGTVAPSQICLSVLVVSGPGIFCTGDILSEGTVTESDLVNDGFQLAATTDQTGSVNHQIIKIYTK